MIIKFDFLHKTRLGTFLNNVPDICKNIKYTLLFVAMK